MNLDLSDLDQFLIDHLTLWKETTVEAPANELQSIAAWQSYLMKHGAEDTLRCMTERMIILCEAVNAIQVAENKERIEAEIHKNRTLPE